jgi:hypothetical protein
VVLLFIAGKLRLEEAMNVATGMDSKGVLPSLLFGAMKMWHVLIMYLNFVQVLSKVDWVTYKVTSECLL